MGSSSSNGPEERARPYFEMIKNSSVGWIVVQDDVVAFASPAMSDLLGVDAIGLMGRPVQKALRFLHPEDRDTFLDRFQRRLAGDSVEHKFEIRVDRPTGDPLWLSVDASIVTFAGQPASQAVITDVTDLKRTEKALRESEHRFRALTESTTAGIFIYRGDRTLYVNPAAATLTGYSREELLGMNFMQIIHPDDLKIVGARAKARLAGQDIVERYEVRILRKDGGALWLDFAGSKIDFDGQPAVLGTVFDVTARRDAEEEQRKLQAQLLHAQKLESLGLLAGGIAHDFNNLLVGVLGNAELIRIDVPPDSPAAEPLRHLETTARRLADFTHQLLAYSGRGTFEKKPVDLGGLVEEMAGLLSLSVGKNAEFQIAVPPGLPPVEGQATQLRQIVLNLVTNATEAVGEGPGRVRVMARPCQVDENSPDLYSFDEPPQPGSYICLEISDTGRGMSEDVVRRIFDPFFTTRATGRGLGLAVVLGIVRGHGGAVRVASTPGEGTRFEVYLPVSDRPVTPVPVEPILDHSIEDLAVLVVDDDPTVRAVTRRILEREGYTVTTANDGLDAIGQVKDVESPKVDLVLLDLTMPNLGGADTLEEIRRLRPDLPVILASGYDESDALSRVDRTKVAGFLPKPFNARALLEILRSAIEGDVKRFSSEPGKPG